MKYAVLKWQRKWVPEVPQIKTGVFGIQYKTQPSDFRGHWDAYWVLIEEEKETHMGVGRVAALNELSKQGWEVVSVYSDGNAMLLVNKESGA